MSKDEEKGDGQEEVNDDLIPKDEKDRLLYWSIAFIVALVALFFAFSVFSSSSEPEYETVEYNNWIFTKIGGLWFFEWQKEGTIYKIPLRFNPYEVQDVKISGKIDRDLFNAENYVYITYDLSNETSQNFSILTLASAELSQNLVSAIDRLIIPACANNRSTACIGRKIKNCQNTDEPVIFLKEGGESSIKLNNACITVSGEGLGALKAVDRLLYIWYGIM